MKPILFAALIAMGHPAQDTATFSDSVLGLAFTHPKTWTQVKKTKDTVRYSIPIDGSAGGAELEIIRSPFSADKELWQTIQVRANETLQREVVRQWEQDIFQVPMLFTQVNWTDKGTPKTTMSGLYYTRTPLKMLVRLTAPSGDFEKVRYEFQTALESLRTLDGAAPKEDDGSAKYEPKKKPEPPPVKPTIIDTGKRDVKYVKAPVTVPLTVSTKPVTLHLPEGWKSEVDESGKVTLKHEKLSAPIVLEVRYGLDSEPPNEALTKRAASSLNDFKAGIVREDKYPKENRGGCVVGTVSRTGKTEGGDLLTFDAAGLQGDFYFLMSFRGTTNSTFAADKKLIRELLDLVSLEATTP